MITVSKCDRSYLQCQSCEATENVMNISVAINDNTGAIQASSLRLCLACIAELTRQVITKEGRPD